MSLTYKPDWPEAQQHFLAWWEGEALERCALAVTAPRAGTGVSAPQPPVFPDDPLTRWTDLDFIAELNTYHHATTFYGGEAFPIWEAGYPGHAAIPAFLGCPTALDMETGWWDPVFTGEEWDVHALGQVEDGPWWRFTIDMLERAASESAGHSLPSIGAFGGCGDTLAALRGTWQLLHDVMRVPEQVREAELYLMDMWCDVYDTFYAIVHAAAGGSTCWFRLWSPGKFYAAHNDFSYMISPKMLTELFLPAVERQTQFLDHCVYHVDGIMAFRHVPTLLELPRLQAYQILPGAGKPSPLHYLDTLRLVQAHRKNLHITIPPEEVEPALSLLSARGLFIETHCETEEHARWLLRQAEKWSRDRAVFPGTPAPRAANGEGAAMPPITARAQMALDTILQRPTQGVPSWLLNIMQHSAIERLAGTPPGSYERDPEAVYVAMQRAIGTCMLDQYIPDNPLTMSDTGYDDREKKATEGAEAIVVDGMVIASPEDVAAHMEQIAFPRLREAIAAFDEDAVVAGILAEEAAIQAKLGPDILKTGYEFVHFPGLAYSLYGYTDYFMAVALYPDVLERHFSLQADLALLQNRAAARAYREGDLPPYYRLDHDIADSRSTLISLRALDRLWLPHFARALEPLLKTDVRMIWHCDGNLMQMVPRLLDTGIRGFQGFQYEDGMDYERICAMKTRDGEPLLIVGGVSVTRTLPFGSPADVKRELAWLVECGPPTGLFLGGSSSIAPGTPWANIAMLVEGLQYYQMHGR